MDTNTGLADPAGSGGEGPLRRSHRAVQRVRTGPPVPLAREERVHVVVDAVRREGLQTRLDFGFLWPRYLEVKLWVTDRRLIEVATPFDGRAAGQRIREYPWSGVRTARVHGRDLELEPGAGSKTRWLVTRRRDVARLREATDARRPLMAGHVDTTSSASTLCPRCAARISLPNDRCDACAARFVTPRAATWLAILVPGGGHLATGHWFVGICRLLAEAAILTVLWWSLLGEVDWPQLVLPFAVVTAVLLAAVKLEAAMTARAYARLVVPWSRRARQTWSILAAAGGILLVTCYASALLNVRQTNRTVLHDLEFHAADALGWEAAYDEPYKKEVSGRIHRSQWTHVNRWTLEVVAEPLAPFQSPEAWVEAENARRRSEGWAAGESFTAGAVDGVRFTRIEGEGWDAPARLEYAVFDRRQRDVHVVSCDLFAGQIDEVGALVASLLRRAHWTKTGQPCNGEWRAD